MNDLPGRRRQTARAAQRRLRGLSGAVLLAVACALLLGSAATRAAAAGPPPRSALIQARTDVQALAPHARSDSARTWTAGAVSQLARASDPSLWIDARDAVAPSYGTSVFVDSAAALADLHRLGQSSSVPRRALGVATALVAGADRDLAQGAIAQAPGGNQALLAAAASSLATGRREAAHGRFQSAARFYGTAWQSAFQALSELVAAQATGLPSSDLTAAAEAALGSKTIGLAGPVLKSRLRPLSLNAKPELFFAGSEACPFCAVERWGMIVALSQFGTFSNLHLMQSESDPTEPPVVRTFTFFGSSYHSPYVSFQPVEVLSNVPHAFGFTHLQHLTAPESGLVKRFDPQGVTPFIDVANRFIRVDSTVQPTLLRGLSWTQIADSLRHPTTIAAQAIGGEAEVLTAELCEATNGNPASACSSAVVGQYQAALPLLDGKGGGCPPTGTMNAVPRLQRAREPFAGAARCNT
jgi:Domain of unknown function (DUF929)